MSNNASTEMTDLSGIVECYVRSVRLSQTITDSFDSFVEKINHLISTLRPIHCIQYGDDMRFIRCSVSNAKLMQPRMLEKDTTSRPIYPQECRLYQTSIESSSTAVLAVYLFRAFHTKMYIILLIERGTSTQARIRVRNNNNCHQGTLNFFALAAELRTQ